MNWSVSVDENSRVDPNDESRVDAAASDEARVVPEGSEGPTEEHEEVSMAERFTGYPDGCYP